MIHTANSCYYIQKCSLCMVAIIWSGTDHTPKIQRILMHTTQDTLSLSIQSVAPGSILRSCEPIDAVAQKLRAYLAGEDVTLPLDAVSLDGCPAFQQKVLRAEYAIPRGRVSTYKHIARHLSNPRGARAVGSALAHNPFPLIIPCHRAVRSDGSLGGYQGGLHMKKALLEMEGIVFIDADHVKTKNFYYTGSEIS